MTLVKEVIQHLEEFAPPAYQESYDNSRLLTGDKNSEVTGILVTLDCTEEIIEEAIENGINLIIAHHPVIFGGLKKLTGSNYVERTVIKAIKNDIAIYACHTNLDNVNQGVSNKICEKLKLNNRRILAPKKGLLKKLTVFVPGQNADNLLDALNDAGAGQIGNYNNCSFQLEGYGTFQPNENANPTIGSNGQLEKVKETRIEVIFPAYLEGKIMNAMKDAHPYEEVAHYIHKLENTHQEVGSGMVGELEKPLTKEEFIAHLKHSMELEVVKHTKFLSDKIHTIAVCGGAGGFLLNNAKGAQADVFITSDFKYHEYFDAENDITIADIGHYESEVFTKDLFSEILSEKFVNIAVVCSKVITNPIFYS